MLYIGNKKFASWKTLATFLLQSMDGDHLVLPAFDSSSKRLFVIRTDDLKSVADVLLRLRGPETERNMRLFDVETLGNQQVLLYFARRIDWVEAKRGFVYIKDARSLLKAIEQW